jgi:hypothetical protein
VDAYTIIQGLRGMSENQARAKRYNISTCLKPSVGLTSLLGTWAEGLERSPQHHRAYRASDIPTHRVTFVFYVFHREMEIASATEVLSQSLQWRLQAVEYPANHHAGDPRDCDGAEALVNGKGLIGAGGCWTKVSQWWTHVDSR